MHCWVFSHYLRAQITTACKQLAFKQDVTRKKKYLNNHQIFKDEEAINNIMVAVSCMINPFTSVEDQIINISSGDVAEKEVGKT